MPRSFLVRSRRTSGRKKLIGFTAGKPALSVGSLGGTWRPPSPSPEAGCSRGSPAQAEADVFGLQGPAGLAWDGHCPQPQPQPATAVTAPSLQPHLPLPPPTAQPPRQFKVTQEDWGAGAAEGQTLLRSRPSPVFLPLGGTGRSGGSPAWPPFHGSVLPPGEAVPVRRVREEFPALLHPVHTPAYPLGHAAPPLPLLRQALPPEIRHEEAHVYPHRCGPGRGGGKGLGEGQAARLQDPTPRGLGKTAGGLPRPIASQPAPALGEGSWKGAQLVVSLTSPQRYFGQAS
ncbi:uncharacterized protein LOC141561443 isoform X1 [Sminthopsis crassicaudata]|uniref:uncharacterized protein LOC141561443 isoform X1 n=1 Tax=Sminthopsis crassicaudata TaxID=9301 RepID=UPI003D69BBFC